MIKTDFNFNLRRISSMKTMNKMLVAGALMAAASGAMAGAVNFQNNTGGVITVTANGKPVTSIPAGYSSIDAGPTLSACGFASSSCPLVFTTNQGTKISINISTPLVNLKGCTPSTCTFTGYVVTVDKAPLNSYIGKTLLTHTVQLDPAK
jgi:hypothetical protein